VGWHALLFVRSRQFADERRTRSAEQLPGKRAGLGFESHRGARLAECVVGCFSQLCTYSLFVCCNVNACPVNSLHQHPCSVRCCTERIPGLSQLQQPRLREATHNMHGNNFELPQTSDGSRVALSLQAHHEKGLQLLVTVSCESLAHIILQAVLVPWPASLPPTVCFHIICVWPVVLNDVLCCIRLPCLMYICCCCTAVAQKPQGPDGLPAVPVVPPSLAVRKKQRWWVGLLKLLAGAAGTAALVGAVAFAAGQVSLRAMASKQCSEMCMLYHAAISEDWLSLCCVASRPWGSKQSSGNCCSCHPSYMQGTPSCSACNSSNRVHLPP
jgi:hypothetical protein